MMFNWLLSTMVFASQLATQANSLLPDIRQHYTYSPRTAVIDNLPAVMAG
jgi:hypothetical protein